MLTSFRHDSLKRILVRYCSFPGNQGTTQYSEDVTARYARAKKDMYWYYDGLQSTVLSQLNKINNSSSMVASEMKVIDIACGDGNYSRAISDRFGYRHIVGVDKSRFQLDLAHQRTPSDSYSNITYHAVDVGSESSNNKMNTAEALGGPFDIALAIWLFNYAESKKELYDMLRWMNQVMKPGGKMIAVTCAIGDLCNADNGLFKNDPKFRVQQIFDDSVKEGPFLLRLGDKGDTMDFMTQMFTFNSYYTLFEISGFEKLHFLEGDDCKIEGFANSTDAEQAMFKEFYSWKGSVVKVLTATKV